MTSIINIIGNSFPAKLLRSAIKFRNACRKINFSYCKVHSVLKLNLACLMYFTCQYLLKLSSSSVMICFIHTWFTEPMSSSCRTIDSNSIVHTKFGYTWPRIANTNVPIPRENMIVRNSPYLQEVQPSQWKLALGVAII